ncbi:hypothetical protein KUTeg_018552 [Tegillarca granosa]|uniref:Uncharacterized protein n=1 Tax=Tegillarca granosa TaxID=220873 RepID=A0ABQ9EI29_TEGGR|nr:hypothetical protein KUTeg_018552 [Tegillarca granosa]
MTHQQEIKDLPVDGFQEKVFEMLYQFQQEDFMCDAIIFGKDGSVPAHKIILMASSKFFRDKIVNRENYFCESMFYLHDYSVTDIENVIRMFYTGRLMFDRERIGSFSKLCQELHLDGMVKVCQEILKKSHTKGLHRASNMQQKYKRDKLSFYDNVSDISSVPSDSEDSSNTQVQNTIKDSSLIYKSAKSLSELYGLSTRSLHYSSSDHLSDLESTKGNIQASHIKSEEGQISCEVFSSKTGILQSVHTNTICENNSDISKAESNVSNDNSTDESNGRIPIENCLMNSMCSSKPLTALSEDLNLSASSELELSPFHNEGQRNDFSSSGSDKLTDSSNIFSDNDTFTTKFQCKFCSRKFSSLKNLMKHKIRIHKCKTSHKKKNIEKSKYQNSKEHKIKKDEMIMKQEVSKEFTQENGTEGKRDENMKTLSKTAFEIQNGMQSRNWFNK